MPRFGLPQIFLRRRTGFIVLFGSSAVSGYAYRSYVSSKSASESLNPHTFAPYSLLSKKPVSTTSSIFTLQPQSLGEQSNSLVDETWKKGVWSVQIKQPQLQIARSYTPLPCVDTQSSNDICLLIRREEGGEVSNYLHKLPEQATVALRGPYVELEIPESVKRVIFLAGGTGIAPAMQLANLLKSREDMKMHILWANRRREDCVGSVTGSSASGRAGGWRGLIGLKKTAAVQQHGHESLEKGTIVKALHDLLRQANPDSLEVEYFVDEERTFIQTSHVSHHAKQLMQDMIVNQSGDMLILVSGPDGFIEHWAGRKVWVDGQEAQGPLRGALAQMQLAGWKVIKL